MRDIYNRIEQLQRTISLFNNDDIVRLIIHNNDYKPSEFKIDKFYFNYITNELNYFNKITRKFETLNLDSSSFSFSDLVDSLQEGDNVTLDVDLVNETITINSTVAPTVTYIRRSDYILLDRKSFIGIAHTGSLETDAVWTIWVTITNTAGEVVSNTQYTNKKWSERNLL